MNIYFYPNLETKKTLTQNPFIDDFINEVKNYSVIVNKSSSYGILNIFKYIRIANIFLLNWIEDLPDRKLGLLQTIVFFLFLIINKRIFKKKVVWVKHNTESHTFRKRFIKSLIKKIIIKNVDGIISFSGNWQEKFDKKKVFIHHHPTKGPIEIKKGDNIYDFLIWGSIVPHKNILDFLEYLKENNLDKKYRILIKGKSLYPEYFSKIKKYENNYIKIQDGFVNDTELKELISISCYVLFTYSNGSISSSGVLMDTLRYRAKILAYPVGAFKELSKIGLLKTYNDFEEIPKLFEMYKDMAVNDILINSFLEKNSWSNFGKELNKWLMEV